MFPRSTCRENIRVLVIKSAQNVVWNCLDNRLRLMKRCGTKPSLLVSLSVICGNQKTTQEKLLLCLILAKEILSYECSIDTLERHVMELNYSSQPVCDKLREYETPKAITLCTLCSWSKFGEWSVYNKHIYDLHFIVHRTKSLMQCGKYDVCIC